MSTSRDRLSVLRRPLVAGALLSLVACSLVRGTRVEPVLPEASLELARARALLRGDEPGARDEALEAARRAATAAPDWVAPRRFVDDLAREDLLAGEALAAHLAALESADRAAAARLLYLAGRLEGAAGIDRFEHAKQISPAFAWAHHGAAWMRFTSGDAGAAVADGRRALELARDPWERSYFAIALARYLAATERGGEAVELMASAVPGEALAPADRATFEVFRAELELAQDDDAVRERGRQRALERLTDPLLSAEEVLRLVTALRREAARTSSPSVGNALEVALGRRDDAASRSLRAELLLERGAADLARALSSADDPPQSDPDWRAAALAQGDAARTAEVMERWLDGVPRQAKGADGLPREPALRALVELVREDAGESLEARRDHAKRFGEALLAAGWFTEARGHAAALARLDAEAGLALDARAGEGIALLQSVGRTLQRVDTGSAVAGSSRPIDRARDGAAPAVAPELELDVEPDVRPIRSLDELLSAVQRAFDRYGRGDERLGDSPVVAFGPFASVVHPGPRFSERDEADGLGRAGETVPGLAAAFARIGRFALFGEVVGGGGPDGTVLRRLAVEQRRGEHLGVGFEGTVVWCEGSDVPSRPARLGAPIHGAALHEGYWIDVEGARSRLAYWRALERAFFEDANRPDRAQRALSGTGPPLASGGHPSNQRIRPYAPGDEADRVRLAVLRDRRAARGTIGTAAPARPSFALEDLLEVTAVHEEGHLCDRERFLPLSRNLFGVAGLLLRARLSPTRVAELLEYRAQLVALCEVSDPRLPLADCLDALGGGGVTPHGAAYRRLMDDLLRELERDLDEHPELDRERYLVHQWHRLDPEAVRRVALALARRVGVDAR